MNKQSTLVHKLVKGYNKEFNESIVVKEILNSKDSFWDVEVGPDTYVFLNLKIIREEKALLKKDAYWLKKNAAKEVDMKNKCVQQARKKLAVEVDEKKKNEIKGILTLMESKLRRLEKWNKRIVLDIEPILSASPVNTLVLPETEDVDTEE
ncbi:hypothetical protein BD770DRAFT_377928, partial [Pilaira anomala]